MKPIQHILAAAMGVSLIAAPAFAASSGITSPNGSVQFKLSYDTNQLKFAVSCKGKTVIEQSTLNFSIDGADVTKNAQMRGLEPYEISEKYPWLGVHSPATNRCSGLRLSLVHPAARLAYVLDVRVFNDAAAFRFSVPWKKEARVPDEATTFILPEKTIAWFHDLGGHYEGIHRKMDVANSKRGEWAAPPVTFKLPDGAGYAAVTEADLQNYPGMALQADGQRGFQIRLGHSHPPSYPYLLRYGTNEAQRLSQPAAIAGLITTPWRVVMVGRDLNTLVNCDAVHNLCPPPDPKLFPKGAATDWIKPGRAVWKYLDGGGSNTLATMKDFTRMAGELGFEYNILEGFWSRWSDAEIKELVSYGKERHVGIWFWKHSRGLKEPQARREFLKRCHELGIAGAKIDFFDHEAKEVIDLYDALLKEAAEFRLLLNFHGANKPTGLSRTWPNELTREAVKGMESSRLENRATHDATLPFTRLLAGPAEYTPMVFSQRRGNTTWAHQIASPAILSTPLLTYGANPYSILTNPCVDMIKSIPSVWDETVVLPDSEIGEVAIFARRSGTTWFLAAMNGVNARKLKLPLAFLGKGQYTTSIVCDNKAGTATQSTLDTPLMSGNSITVELQSGGGFLARFRKK